MIYYLTPLSAAGSITEKEIEGIEANMKKAYYGIKGDISNETIQKVLSFHTAPTARLIAKIGDKLRS